MLYMVLKLIRCSMLSVFIELIAYTTPVYSSRLIFFHSCNSLSRLHFDKIFWGCLTWKKCQPGRFGRWIIIVILQMPSVKKLQKHRENFKKNTPGPEGYLNNRLRHKCLHRDYWSQANFESNETFLKRELGSYTLNTSSRQSLGAVSHTTDGCVSSTSLMKSARSCRTTSRRLVADALLPVSGHMLAYLRFSSGFRGCITARNAWKHKI